jgi:uncharacterized protein VirK/YbjX
LAGQAQVFISSFLQMARQRHYWSSPSRFVRIVWSLTSNLHRQFEVFRILSLPAFNSLVLAHPDIPFKYLSTDYLFTGLPVRPRAASFVHHWQFLESHLPSGLLRRRQPLEMTLFERREGENIYTVRLDFPPCYSRYEGESRLGLLVDGVLVYCLQFSIVPGWVVQSKERDVIFILRLQGVKGHYEQIRAATKTLREVAPPALLMAALQGMSSAWGIREMAGISARSQSCYARSQPGYDDSSASLFTQTYDDFFISLGAIRRTSDYFSSPLPLREKSLALVGNGHKSRTLKKRAFKRQIADEVCRWVMENTPAAAVTMPMPDIRATIEERSVAS